jgi:hypothetical protein
MYVQTKSGIYICKEKEEEEKCNFLEGVGEE